MAGQEQTRPQVEIFYALHGGEPFRIGAGTFDDVARASEVKDAINAASAQQPDGSPSPGTMEWVRVMGAESGDSKAAEAAIEHYGSLVDGSREGWLKKLGDVEL